jgi:(p)ppGpp synthase/HD superfamily hydrolase
MIDRIARAAILAAELHRGEQRSGAHAEPYIEHPIRVAQRLEWAAGGVITPWATPLCLFEAALLHDVIEENRASAGAVSALVLKTCGYEVLGLVETLTDDPSWSREERALRQAERAAHGHPSAAVIKLADKLDNVMSMRRSELPAGRALRYCDGAELVVEACDRRLAVGTDPWLRRMAVVLVEEFRREVVLTREWAAGRTVSSAE